MPKLKLGLIITLRFPQCVVAPNELLIEIRIIILPPFVQLMSLAVFGLVPMILIFVVNW